MYLDEYLEVSTGPPSESNVAISYSFYPARIEDFTIAELSDSNQDLTFIFKPTDVSDVGTYEIVIALNDNDIYGPLTNEYSFHLTVKQVIEEVVYVPIDQSGEEEVGDDGAGQSSPPVMELKTIS